MRRIKQRNMEKDIIEFFKQEVRESDNLTECFCRILDHQDDLTDDLKEFMTYYVIKYKELPELIEELELEHFKVCSECGGVMTEGYCIENGMAYYCSDECLHKHMTQEEFDALYDDGRGDSYYTSWVD